MNKILNLIVIAFLITTACSKDDSNEVSYPVDLVPYSEFKNIQLTVGGLDKSTTGLNPGSFLSDEELSKDLAYIKITSDKMLTVDIKSMGEENKLNVPYSFKGDSLVVESQDFEDGCLYLGKGDRNSLKKECGAFAFYGYVIKNGQKEDFNKDEVIDEHDRVHVTGLFNKFISKQDVMDKFGYGSTTPMNANDSIIIYNYTLRFVKDKNGDLIYTEVDN